MTDTATDEPRGFPPMTDADVSASDAATAGEDTAARGTTSERFGGDSIRQALTDRTSEIRGQVGDKVRQFADDGKTRATGALDELAKMLSDAADQVDDKLGAQFGQYARSTADQVQGFSSSLNEKSVDDMVEMARDFVRKSPAAAIGIATALGFVIARLTAAGLEQRGDA